MAVITFLLSFLARKMNDIIQAVFGWSVTALFGRLPRRSQILVTGALLLSLAWPLFVLGAFVPKIAAWAIALVPLHAAIGEKALRVVWIVLAIGAPLLVGLLVWLAAPERASALPIAMLNGYPTSLGFFAAFVITVVTVPILKIASIARRWTDEPVYLQAHEHRYDAVIDSLADATALAGVEARITDVPRHKDLATTVMRTLAGGAVAPFVTEKLKRVEGEKIQISLYPADLLLRGEPQTVARVRAMFTRTKLDHDAYLVSDPKAQKLQAELSRQNHVLDEGTATQLLATQLEQLYGQIMRLDVSYDQWVILDTLARRFERRLLDAHLVAGDDLPIDRVQEQSARAVQNHRASERQRDDRLGTPGRLAVAHD